MDVRRQIIPAYNDLGENVIQRSNDSLSREPRCALLLFHYSSAPQGTFNYFYPSSFYICCSTLLVPYLLLSTPAPKQFSRLLFSSSLSIHKQLLFHLHPRVCPVALSARPLVLPPSLNR